MSGQVTRPQIFTGSAGQRRARKKKKKPLGATQQPIREIKDVNVAPASLVDRLKAIPNLPSDVVELMLTAHYVLESGAEIFLFAGVSNASGKNVPRFNVIEIQEAIGVYFDYLEKRNNEELAKGDFFSYINSLILSQERKAKADLLTHHDIVFESPSLVEYRKQEIIKERIGHRKRRPIKGKCGKSTCSSKEIFMEEVFGTRSGDESGVTTIVCAKCGHKWVNAG